jgi:hypothetical protein
MMAPRPTTGPSASRVPHRTWLWIALGIVWCGCALPGWRALLRHAYEPAASGEVVALWPAGAFAADPSAGFRVVLFAHPCCPCTRATLNKLDESLPRIPGGTSIHVIFVTAGLSPADLSGSTLVDMARGLPGVDVRLDDTGDEARRFGAKISGEVLVFDRQGRRVFHGGLTSARGHDGESAAQQQLERTLRGQSYDSYTAPVYGCALPAGGRAAAGPQSKLNAREPLSADDARYPVTARSFAK